MDDETKAQLATLKDYLDGLPIDHHGWDAVTRLYLIVYGKLMELSAHLAPLEVGKGDKLAENHLAITNALKEISDMVGQGRKAP